jgi:carboxypeptidase PM20D1
MRKLRRLLTRLLLLALLVFAAIFTVNTISFSSKQVTVQPVEPMKIEDAAVERLAGALRLPTVSEEGKIDTAAFRLLDTFFQKNYPLVDSMLEKTTIGGFSSVFKWQGQNARLSPILLMAHLDVVPVEDGGNQWSVEPFSGKIEGGLLWGRGSMDDKSSACGILEAIEMLLQVDYMPQRTVYVAFGHDEEVGGENGAKQIAAYFKQKSIEFEFVLDEGNLVVEDALPGLDKPLALIGIAEKGYATLELTVHLDEGGHSSMPPPGSAINRLSEAIVKLRDNPSPAKIEGPVRSMFDYVGPEMNFFNKIIFANLTWTQGLVKKQMSQGAATNAMLRTTFAPTVVGGGFKENVLPTQAKATVNCRILPGESVESTLKHARKVIDDERVTVSLNVNFAASEPVPPTDMSTFGYSVLQTTVREIFPEAVVAPALVIGATDSRHFQVVSKNILRFQPLQIKRDDLKRFHGIDERIEVESYRQMVRFYRQLMLNSCK